MTSPAIQAADKAQKASSRKPSEVSLDHLNVYCQLCQPIEVNKLRDYEW